MKRITSRQRNVRFVWCPNPITIDKRGEWGDSEDNFQRAPNGAFLKMASETAISHLVQPNADHSAPIGWIPGDSPGTFHKAPIWIIEDILPPGTVYEMDTRDGKIKYEVTEPSLLCYNERDGSPDKTDGWIQAVAAVEKNYIL